MGPNSEGTITLMTVRGIPASAGFPAGKAYTCFEQGLNSTALTNTGWGIVNNTACAYSFLQLAARTHVQVHTIGNAGQFNYQRPPARFYSHPTQLPPKIGASGVATFGSPLYPLCSAAKAESLHVG